MKTSLDKKQKEMTEPEKLAKMMADETAKNRAAMKAKADAKKTKAAAATTAAAAPAAAKPAAAAAAKPAAAAPAPAAKPEVAKAAAAKPALASTDADEGEQAESSESTENTSNNEAESDSESKEKAETEAKEKAETEAKEKAENEAQEKAKAEASEKEQAAADKIEQAMDDDDDDDEKKMHKKVKLDNSEEKESDKEVEKLTKKKKHHHELLQTASSDLSGIQVLAISGDSISNDKKDFSSNEQLQSELGSGDKLMIKQGKIISSSFNEEGNQYYSLVGEAYNKGMLNRAPSASSSKGKSFYTYVIDGKPQTLEHSVENDKKYAYSKIVIGSDKNKKIFSLNCAKLKFNDSEKRQNDCNMATGFFLVHEQNLFKTF